MEKVTAKLDNDTGLGGGGYIPPYQLTQLVQDDIIRPVLGAVSLG